MRRSRRSHGGPRSEGPFSSARPWARRNWKPSWHSRGRFVRWSVFGRRSSCFCTRLRPGRLATCTKRQYLPAWRPFSLCCYSPTMTNPDARRPVRTSSTRMILSTVKGGSIFLTSPFLTRHSRPSFAAPSAAGVAELMMLIRVPEAEIRQYRASTRQTNGQTGK